MSLVLNTYDGKCLFILSNFYQVLCIVMSGKTSGGGETLASCSTDRKTCTRSQVGGDVGVFGFVSASVLLPDNGSPYSCLETKQFCSFMNIYGTPTQRGDTRRPPPRTTSPSSNILLSFHIQPSAGTRISLIQDAYPCLMLLFPSLPYTSLFIVLPSSFTRIQASPIMLCHTHHVPLIFCPCFCHPLHHLSYHTCTPSCYCIGREENT